MSSGEHRRGERNGRAKLTWAHLLLLREQYRKNKRGKFNRQPHGVYSAFSTAALAEQYEMSQSAMWAALTEKSWSRRSA